MQPPSLLVEALIFSSIAVGLVLIFAWWLYLSPLKPAQGEVQLAPARTAQGLALLIGLGTFLLSVGSYWDAGEHVATGIVPGGSDFLWPPHLMLYGGFLLSFVVALVGLGALALPNLRAGVRDPRHWVRANPYLGALALAAGYGLLSIPGDAIWHELFGLDLTAWSPPHILIAMAAISTPMCAAGLLITSRAGRATVSIWIGFIILLYLTLAMSEAFLIGVLEWEFRGVDRLVAQRPIWLYPALIGAIAFFALIFARRLVPRAWTATALALLYFGWRIGIGSFTLAISGAAPRLTLVFLLGALLLDLAAQRFSLTGLRRAVVESAAFTIGYTLIALPTIELVVKSGLLRFSALDHVITFVVTFAAGILVHVAAEQIGGWFLNVRTAPTQTNATLSPASLSIPGD